MTKKYDELELYLLLRMQAKLVEQTKHSVLDKIFKTGCAEKNDISIFSLLGILMDLQDLNVYISHPNFNKNKVNFEDLTSFIVRNLSKMTHTYRKVNCCDNCCENKPLINWMIIGSKSFESKFADFIDYLEDNLGISLVLPSATATVIDDLNVDFTKKPNVEISFK
jgi:hypothetical protein